MYNKIYVFVAIAIIFALCNFAYGSGFELKYWYANWNRGDAEADTNTGMIGFEWNGSGEKYFGGIAFMGGEYGVADGSTEIVRLEGDIKIGRWLSKPNLGIFTGYRFVQFDITDYVYDLGFTLYGDDLYVETEDDSVFERLHGVVIGLVGEIRASDHVFLGDNAKCDYGAYYGASVVPALQYSASNASDVIEPEDLRLWNYEAGLWYQTDNYRFRLGYRYQNISSNLPFDDEFSGVVLALQF